MRQRTYARGFSLIELILVLFIIVILSMAGFSVLGNRTGSAVRAVLDEVEGTILLAHKNSQKSSQHIYLSTKGNWGDRTMVMDGRPVNVPTPILPSSIPAGEDSKRVGSNSECFTVQRDGQYRRAAIPTSAELTWYTTALDGRTSLATDGTIAALPGFVEALNNPIFVGGDKYVLINGLSKEFTEGFSVIVVPRVDENVEKNGPIGVIVVPAGGASIFKFYMPERQNVWRRL